MTQALEEPLLGELGVTHGFGLRDAAAPGGLLRPRQVHGTTVHHARGGARESAAVEADAIACQTPGATVGIVTADCVPLLLAEAGGAWVAAVHAGWRGLTAGIGAATVAWLAERGATPERLRAAIGPHVGPCCYEVDAPVLAAVEARFGATGLAEASRAGRSGHAWLDLGALMTQELLAAGIPAGAIGAAAVACTACDSERFHSYRRDGPRSGRLHHWITAPDDRP
ncbi:MAG: polyphenol oxidase family protein [Myxococcales bacterium]|nr:polyphenol oxidase family protein [Myxococcales bacterium]